VQVYHKSNAAACLPGGGSQADLPPEAIKTILRATSKSPPPLERLGVRPLHYGTCASSVTTSPGAAFQ